MKIFYSHHLYKYGTKIEEMEIRLIKKKFPDADIFNPSVDIAQNRPEEEIMKECLANVISSDILVFSSVSGLVGKGCFNEIAAARIAGVPVYMISGYDIIETEALRHEYTGSGNDREYAVVRPVTKKELEIEEAMLWR